MEAKDRKFFVGLVAIVLGIVGLVYSLITMFSDMADSWGGYSYEPPLTGHEIMIITVLIISVIVAIVGGIILFASKKDTVEVIEVPVGSIGSIYKVKLLTNAEGLGIRKGPNASQEPFTHLPNGTEVELLEIGSVATLNNIKGSWHKIKTNDEIQGWCFSGSLEKT